MCGIAGFVSNKEQDKNKCLKPLRLIRHRGPDESAFWCSGDKRVYLGNARLSIIDVENGHQPVFNEDRTICVVLNGEIYNYRQLSSELISQGHSLNSKSDTDVIPHLYEEYGIDFIKKLDGMYAIALYDKRKNKLFLFRDKVGQKPLYYFYDGIEFYFASEIKAVLSACSRKFQINQKSLNEFFRFGNSVSEETIFKNIFKLLPASFLELDIANLLVKKELYWELPQGISLDTRSYSNLFDEFVEKFEKAVDARMVADVPIGAFLSGGIDSSSVVTAAQYLGYDIKTYSVGFKDKSRCELDAAIETAKILGLENVSLFADENFDFDSLANIMGYFDEPFYDHSAIPTNRISELVSRERKVVLSGDGGDEIMLGYKHYDDFISKASKFMPFVGFSKKISVEMWKLLYNRYFSRISRKDISSLQKTMVDCKNSRYDLVLEKYFSKDLRDWFSKVDYHIYQVEDILVKVDRMSMCHSLEVRSPILDHNMAEFLAQVPSDIKLCKGKKTFLKDYLRLRLGKQAETIINRPKSGFRFPLGKVIEENRDKISDCIIDKDFLSLFDLNEEFVKKLSLDFKFKRKTPGKSVWLLLCLYFWWQNNKGYVEC